MPKKVCEAGFGELSEQKKTSLGNTKISVSDTRSVEAVMGEKEKEEREKDLPRPYCRNSSRRRLSAVS